MLHTTRFTSVPNFSLSRIDYTCISTTYKVKGTGKRYVRDKCIHLSSALLY